jgi:hypothetical protein
MVGDSKAWKGARTPGNPWEGAAGGAKDRAIHGKRQRFARTREKPPRKMESRWKQEGHGEENEKAMGKQKSHGEEKGKAKRGNRRPWGKMENQGAKAARAAPGDLAIAWKPRLKARARAAERFKEAPRGVGPKRRGAGV